MKLLTQEIRASLPGLYETDGVPCEEKTVHVKFFNPIGHAYWLAVEGSQSGENGEDFVFFGYAELLPGCGEWGYFHLSELEGLELPLGMKIERDRFHTPCAFGQFDGRYVKAS